MSYQISTNLEFHPLTKIFVITLEKSWRNGVGYIAALFLIPEHKKEQI